MTEKPQTPDLTITRESVLLLENIEADNALTLDAKVRSLSEARYRVFWTVLEYHLHLARVDHDKTVHYQSPSCVK
jgi:hypothetical protein